MKTLDVIFRVDVGMRGGEWYNEIVTAVFPSMPGTTDPYTAACYARVGQHSSCSRAWYVTTRAATPDEYAPLLAELTRIYGSDRYGPPVHLRVVKRWAAGHDRMRREAIAEVRS